MARWMLNLTVAILSRSMSATTPFKVQSLLFVRTLNVRTLHLVTNHCILTAVAPLSKDNSIQGQLSWEPKHSLPGEVTVHLRQLLWRSKALQQPLRCHTVKLCQSSVSDVDANPACLARWQPCDCLTLCWVLHGSS